VGEKRNKKQTQEEKATIVKGWAAITEALNTLTEPPIRKQKGKKPQRQQLHASIQRSRNQGKKRPALKRINLPLRGAGKKALYGMLVVDNEEVRVGPVKGGKRRHLKEQIVNSCRIEKGGGLP